MTTLVRRIELDAPAEEVWPLLAEPDGWARWLADRADVEVRPGGRGRVVEDGVTREVAVDDVEPLHRVAFRWWPEHDEADESMVELELVPGELPAEHSTVVVTETRGAALAATASLRLWLGFAGRRGSTPTRRPMLAAGAGAGPSRRLGAG